MSDVTAPPTVRGRLVERTVIGVFGNAQHGKDSAAKLIDMLLAGKARRPKRLALADPLKEVAKHLLGMPSDIAWGAEDGDIARREQLRLSWSKYGKNAREWLRWIGTELGRVQIDEALWIDRTVDRIVEDMEGTNYFIITDCRHHNERTLLKQKLAARFIRFMPVRVYRPCVPIDTSHPSETEVASMTASMFDYVIDNDSDLDGLRARVEEFITNHLRVT